MSFKKNKRLSSQLVALMLVVITSSCLFLQNCSKSDNLDVQRKVTEDDVRNLGKKYDLPIQITDKSASKGQVIPNLKELDKIFSSYKNSRKKSCTKALRMSRLDNRIMFQTDRRNRNSGLLRLKSGSEEEAGIWSEDAWYYDLTWLNVDVSWQDNGAGKLTINITSTYNGLNLYEYVQTNFVTNPSGNIITFGITGQQSMTIGLDAFGIHFTDHVSATGWVNIATGEGAVVIDKSNYWF